MGLVARRAHFLLLATLILFAAACAAQSASPAAQGDAPAVYAPHWDFGVLVGGGSGLADNNNVQYVRAGVRVGRVVTRERGHGLLRGTFEWDAEVMPVDYVLWSGYRNVYGFGFNPLIWKWNFTHGRKAVPYFLAQGGILWSTDFVPPGDTSHFNFTTGAGIGVNYFVKPGRSWNIDLRATHLSNASLGDENPGINASLQLSIGYNWWKH